MMKLLFIIFIMINGLVWSQDFEEVAIRKNPPWFRGERSQKNANTCSKVDLIEKSGPVRNQTHGTCYAYAAMELLNFDKKPLFSALHLAELVGSQNKSPQKRNNKLLDQLQGFSGSGIETALTVGLKSDLCPEEYVSSVAEQDENYETVLEFYQVAKDAHLNLEELNCAVENKELMSSFSSIFPKFNLIDFFKAYQVSNNLSEFAERLTFANCQDHLVSGLHLKKKVTTTNAYYDDDKKQTAGVYRTGQREMIKHLDLALSEGKPVAISYLSSGLVSSFAGVQDKNDNHASVIVGRKWIDEIKNSQGEVIQKAACFYVAKNSWGVDWQAPENVKAKNVEGHPGYFMVSEDDLLGFMYGTVTLDDVTSGTLDNSKSPAGPK